MGPSVCNFFDSFKSAKKYLYLCQTFRKIFFSRLIIFWKLWNKTKRFKKGKSPCLNISRLIWHPFLHTDSIFSKSWPPQYRKVHAFGMNSTENLPPENRKQYWRKAPKCIEYPQQFLSAVVSTSPLPFLGFAFFLTCRAFSDMPFWNCAEYRIFTRNWLNFA